MVWRKHYLDESICIRVDAGGRFIHDQHLCSAQERPGHAEELSFTHAEVQASLPHNSLELVGQVPDLLCKLCGGEDGPELVVAVVPEGVEVAADGTGEERWLLGNDSQDPPQICEAQASGIHPVQDHTPAHRLQEAE